MKRIRTEFFVIGLAWILSRGLALLAIHSRIPFYWEVFEVKKLWEYGFLHRAGALVNIQYLPGHLSNPEVFNYVNHPYPIMWVFACAYRIFGAGGMMAIVLIVGLFSCLAVLVVLHRSFAAGPAFFASLLYTLAPSTILFDVDTNLIVLGAVIWPAAALIVTGPAAQRGDPSAHWVLGVVIFFCGQISWFALTTLPALMVVTARPDVSLFQEIRKPWQNRLWLAIIIGGAASLSLFLLQVLLYSSNLSVSLAYAFAHTGSDGGFFSSRSKMILFISAKACLLIGPALIAGALCGLLYYGKSDRENALLRGAVVGITCVLIAGLVLIRFFYRERTPYAYVLFPAAVLTAYVLERMRYWAYAALGGLAALGLLYVCLQVIPPNISPAGLSVAEFLRSTTRPDEVVVSNLREQESPFPAWDTGSRDATMLAADRLLYYGIENAAQLNQRMQDFRVQEILPRFVFLRDVRRPVSTDLEQALKHDGRLLMTKSLSIPSEKESLTLKLRSFYWRITGSPFAQADAKLKSNVSEEVPLELYQLN